MTASRRDNQHLSGFASWVRTVPELDSRNAGLCCQDIDWIWHQFRETKDNNGIRKINNLMLIEEKSRGADLSFAQRDTMWITHQMLSASKSTLVRNAREELVRVKYWGYFKLRYSGDSPDNSEWIEWNKTRITLDKLIAILRFDLRPDTLKPNDRRTNHHVRNDSWLFVP